MRLLLLACALAAADDSYLDRVLEPANRLLNRPEAEAPAVVPGRDSLTATETFNFQWRGQNTSVVLPVTAALSRGVAVRLFDGGGYKLIPQEGLRFLVGANTLVIVADVPASLNQSMTVFYDSAAKIDSVRYLHPDLKTISARLFVERARADRSAVAACRLMGEVLQTASADAYPAYETFRASEENLPRLFELLNGLTGCAKADFPESSGP